MMEGINLDRLDGAGQDLKSPFSMEKKEQKLTDINCLIYHERTP
jgi:hypothetical protein